MVWIPVFNYVWALALAAGWSIALLAYIGAARRASFRSARRGSRRERRSTIRRFRDGRARWTLERRSCSGSTCGRVLCATALSTSRACALSERQAVGAAELEPAPGEQPRRPARRVPCPPSPRPRRRARAAGRARGASVAAHALELARARACRTWSAPRARRCPRRASHATSSRSSSCAPRRASTSTSAPRSDARAAAQVRIDQRRERAPLLLADRGVAVAGQVDQVHALLDQVEVHAPRAARACCWCARGPCGRRAC